MSTFRDCLSVGTSFSLDEGTQSACHLTRQWHMADRNSQDPNKTSPDLTRRGIFTVAAAIFTFGATAGLTALAQESPERRNGSSEDRKESAPKLDKDAERREPQHDNGSDIHAKSGKVDERRDDRPQRRPEEFRPEPPRQDHRRSRHHRHEQEVRKPHHRMRQRRQSRDDR